MAPKKPITHPALASWAALNAYLMEHKQVYVIDSLLMAEKQGRRRAMFMRRIQSRLNRLRTQAASAKLEELLK